MCLARTNSNNIYRRKYVLIENYSNYTRLGQTVTKIFTKKKNCLKLPRKFNEYIFKTVYEEYVNMYSRNHSINPVKVILISFKEIMNKESRISAAIDSGYILNNDGKWHNIYSEKGLNILGNIIEGNADSYNTEFYGSIDTLARKILGYNLEAASKYQIVPSALEIFSTSMKDPAFYRIYKRIIDYYHR